MPAPIILSLQSRVALGHVGNSAAAFVLQRLGCEVLELPTVLLSAHPGHGRPGGGAVPATLLAGMLDGLERIGALERVAGVIIGYLGSADNGEVAADAIARVRAANPRALVLVDPVIGDRDGGQYVSADVADCFRRLIPLADIVKPNHFELEMLAGRPLATLAEAVEALQDLGAALPLVTSFEVAGDRLATLALIEGQPRLALTAMVQNPPHGLGDTLGAALMGHLVTGIPAEAALARALGLVDTLIRMAADWGRNELPLVEAQALIGQAYPLPVIGIQDFRP